MVATYLAGEDRSPVVLYASCRLGAFDGRNPCDHIEQPMANPPNRSPPLIQYGDQIARVCAELELHRLDVRDVDGRRYHCFIPEVVWNASNRTTPLERLYDIHMALECFDRSTGRPVVIPKLRNKANLSAKTPPPDGPAKVHW